VKVALLHKRLAPVGGTEGYVWELAGRLAAAGEEVHVVCAEAEGVPDPRVRVRQVPILPLGPTARMVSFALSAERFLGRERYDLVHGFGKTLRHDLFRLGGGCHATYLERAHAAGRPEWVRGLARSTPHQRAALAIERRTFAPGNYRLLVANSRMVRDDLVARYGVPAERVRVLYSGVDLERFHPRLRRTLGEEVRRQRGLSPEEVLLGFVGTGFVRKGLAPLLRALAILRARGERVRLLVVGRDRRERAFRRLASRLGLDGSVSFVGARSDPERFLAASDLFVLPTLYDPFANATLEAMACGVPAVTTEANGAAEAIEAGKSGAVLPAPASPEAIADRILPFLDRRAREKASAAARGAAERFPREAHYREVLRLYPEVLAGKGGGPARA
jgi:UDP-glucose:(heptosyl)LPS alpha-1,3-glucosyltransferase